MRPPTPKEIGARIRQARLDEQLTQTQLAEKIGVSRFWVAEVERGKAGAELGLVLKALNALRLVLTIRTQEENRQYQAQLTATLNDEVSAEFDIDLQSILNRASDTTVSPGDSHRSTSASLSPGFRQIVPPRKPGSTTARKHKPSTRRRHK